MDDRCYRCGKGVNELMDNGVEINEDGYCDECFEKLMQQWEREAEELNKYWRNTRL